MYSHADAAYISGDLNAAGREAQQARLALSTVNSEWAVRFRLLEAEALIYQGNKGHTALTLLADNTAPFPRDGDLAIKRELLLALAYSSVNEPAHADKSIGKARRLLASSSSGLEGELLFTEASVRDDRNDLDAAATLYWKSLELARTRKDAFLQAHDLLNLGMISLETSRYDQAVSLFKQCAGFADLVHARQFSEVASGDLGLSYLRLGDSENALAYLAQAVEQAKALANSREESLWLFDEGLADHYLHRDQEAASFFQKSLAIAQHGNYKQAVAGASLGMGFLLYDQGQLNAAQPYADIAFRTAEASGDKGAKVQAEYLRALLASRRYDPATAQRELLDTYQDTKRNLPALTSTLEDEIANSYRQRTNTVDAELWYRRSISTFEKDRAAVQDEELRLPFFATADSLYRDYADFLIDTHHPEKALDFLDRGRARTLSEGLDTSQTNSPQAVTKTLDAQAVARNLHAVILFYSLGADKSYLWAINSSKTQFVVLPRAADIETRIEAYQKTILRSQDFLRNADGNSTYLYHALVAPAAGMIPAGSNVIVVADGRLNELNFETLLAPGAGNPHYWIEDVTITNANSIRLLTRSRPRADEGGQKNLLLMGDPVSSTVEFGRLAYAGAEVAKIERHFPVEQRTTLTRAAAQPASYETSRPDRYAYIHFVSHGTASRLSPLDSAVVLSPPLNSEPAGRPDNFKLYAREIIKHPLHARLVTISACYGSGLRTYAGEGLVGLSWAFLRAGSHNVIGALWAVDDASTPQLMDRMYGEIEAGQTPAAALRTAKLSLLHSTGVYRKPMYWGAFQLYSGS